MQPLVVGRPGFPVAVQTVPVGVTSASASLTVHWLGSPDSTVTGSVTFSPRCGPSQPWATFVMPGQQRTVIIGEPALLEVIECDTANIGNDFYVTNFNTPPNPSCEGEPIRPDAPGQPGGGGSGGGAGSISTASADATVTATPTAASSASHSDGPFVAVPTKNTTAAANGPPGQVRSFAPLGWTVAAVAVLLAAGGLLAWLRLRRRTVPTQSPTGE